MYRDTHRRNTPQYNTVRCYYYWFYGMYDVLINAMKRIINIIIKIMCLP